MDGEEGVTRLRTERSFAFHKSRCAFHGLHSNHASQSEVHTINGQQKYAPYQYLLVLVEACAVPNKSFVNQLLRRSDRQEPNSETSLH